ncbi:hypothetical protein BJY04DRAFT_66823 [Aspergillus karnatakaensis]|uniref:uncharacterized protein n=1 Tax=Aspergillus karnatakaensis TaxID=1810916 RepID=UPI003CCCADBD
MLCQSSHEYSRQMSFAQTGCNTSEEMEDYYASMHPHWPGLERSPYAVVNHPYNAPYQTSAILTPISLPEHTYAHTRTSPVISHHSQEYQYSVSESIPHHGLGITTPFPSELTADPNVGLGIAPTGYGLREETFSPQPSRKRARRGSRQSLPREQPPVSILPHPEGLQRLEQERRQSYTDSNSQRPRAPGRGRRDPQAEEEDAFVEELREQNLAWKVIREMFRERYNKDATEARLQMRQSRRRKERLAQWAEHDIQVLLRARHYWEQQKYRFIAQKMAELGATTAYTAEQCEAQLDYIDARERERAERHNGQQSEAPEPQRKRRRTESNAKGEISQRPISRTKKAKTSG